MSESIDNGGFGGAGDFGAASFDGSIEASAGGSGIGGGNGIGGASGQGIGTDNSTGGGASPDFGTGLSMTGADAASLGALGAITLGGYLGLTGLPGALLAASGYTASTYASNPLIAAAHLGQDIGTTLGQTVAVNANAFAGQQ